jgi:hypothetical protein
MSYKTNLNFLTFQSITVDELNRLLGIVVDVENLFMCVHKEEDADTKQARRKFLTYGVRIAKATQF